MYIYFKDVGVTLLIWANLTQNVLAKMFRNVIYNSDLFLHLRVPFYPATQPSSHNIQA